MKRILLLGANGMAGHIIYYYLSKNRQYEIIDVVHSCKLTENSIIADVNDIDKIAQIIINQSPDIIINCIGILIEKSRNYPEKAIFINAYFPYFLKNMADKINAKLIHISTDCVFSGMKGGYADDDFRDADDIYGRSKALGEIIDDRNLTIRTSIIGPELKKNGEGLFHWFMQQHGEVLGYTKAIWGGVTTLQLAKAIEVLITQNTIGLVQLTNGDKISKYNLLEMFKDIWRRDDLIIKPYAGKVIDKSIQISSNLPYIVPTFREMLQEQYLWMKEYKHLYSDIYSINY